MSRPNFRNSRISGYQAIILTAVLIGKIECDPLRSSFEVTEHSSEAFLERYGYLPEGTYAPGSQKRRSKDEEFLGALKNLQRNYALEETGVLDMETKEAIVKPRCGMKDSNIGEIGSLTTKYMDKHLTYRIQSFATNLMKNEVLFGLKKAFKLWSNVTPLTFKRVCPNKTATFTINFFQGYHNDFYPFDGSGGSLAHASFPPNGDVHFDDDEDFKIFTSLHIKERSKSIDFLSVAAHEIGHSLGLRHSQDINDLMAPFYTKPVDNFGNFKEIHLRQGDKDRIRALYGKNPCRRK